MKKTGRSVVLVTLGMITMLGTANAANRWDCTTQDVMPAVDAGAGGASALCLKSGIIKANMEVTGLAPSNAYTVWWVYFDDPAACVTPFECGMPDFEGADPQAVFGRMDSGIAGNRGKLRFSGRFRGMVPSADSQIWLLIFGHGPADYSDGRHLSRQLLTPEDPLAGAPHLGIVGQANGYPVALSVFVLD